MLTLSKNIKTEDKETAKNWSPKEVSIDISYNPITHPHSNYSENGANNPELKALDSEDSE